MSNIHLHHIVCHSTPRHLYFFRTVLIRSESKTSAKTTVYRSIPMLVQVIFLHHTSHRAPDGLPFPQNI